MKQFFLYIYTIVLCTTISVAQTPTQVQQLFDKRDYLVAKQQLQQLLQRAAGNARYNYMYGVACVETGSYAEAIPYLRKANPKRLPEVYPYLAKALQSAYYFDEAVTTWEEYIAWLQRKKQDTQTADTALEKAKQGQRMMRSVQQVMVIDSAVVEKSRLFHALRYGEEIGTMDWTTSALQSTYYEDAWQQKRIIAQPTTTKNIGLFTTTLQFDTWEEPSPISSLNKEGTDTNYPFLLTDGITLYFASNSAEGIGGYDLYVTRYDTESGTYLRPENLGFPFNSPYNDYLYIVDEYAGIGWLVSDRHQPTDKVCIYTLALPKNRETYDYDSKPIEEMAMLAQLSSIVQTQTDKELLKRTQALLPATSRKESVEESYTFVINDKIVRRHPREFLSVEARNVALACRMKERSYETIHEELERLREKYHRGERNLARRILKLEADTRKLQTEIAEQKQKAVRLELEKINL